MYSDFSGYTVSADGDGDFIADEPLAVTVNAAVALLSAELDLSDSATLTAAQKADAEERLNEYVSLKFSKGNAEPIAFGYVAVDQTAKSYLRDVNQGDTIQYSVSGWGIADQTGSFTLSDVLYRGTLTLKPGPAVLAWMITSVGVS